MADLLGRETTDLAELAGMESLAVQGQSLYPALRDGDLVFYHPLSEGLYNITDLHGIECIVQLDTGQRMVRQIFLQPDGRITLNGYGVPPTYNAIVIAASPVEYVRRAHIPRPIR